MNEHQERAGQLSIFTTCWIFARGYYGVSLSIDEFHIFKAAHRSWTLALVRISNSRCYASRAHSVQKSFFFKELPIFPERPICTGWPKLFSKKIACEVIWIFVTALFFIFQEITMQSPNNALVLMSWPKKNAFAFISFHSLSPACYVSTQRSCLKRFFKSIIIL